MMHKTRPIRSKPGARIKPNRKAVKRANKLKTGKPKIQSKEVYELTMKGIDALMRKGEENLSEKELDRLRILSEAAEGYEDVHDPLPIPSSLPDMIRMKMFQLKLKQHYAARLLGVSEL